MSEIQTKQSGRIWEIDFIRGIAVLCVIFIHVVFDMNYIFDVFDKPFLAGNPVFDAVQQYGSLVFIIISGICVSFGGKNLRRGMIVLLGGVGITVVTYAMIWMGFLDRGNKIDFGILSCLGLCMICWTLFKDCNKYALLFVGVMLVVAGYYIESFNAPNSYLAFLGIKSSSYCAGDYFPFIRNFGWYLIGGFLGRSVYKTRKSLMPFFTDKTPVINVFCFVGRNTLIIYLAHQPLVFGILYLLFPMK